MENPSPLTRLRSIAGADAPIQDTGRVGLIVRLLLHTWKQMQHDRANQMAAALTYRTIFSMVPTLLLALVVFRAFGGFADMQTEMRQRIFDYLNITAIQSNAPTPHATDSEQSEPATTESSDNAQTQSVDAHVSTTAPTSTKPAAQSSNVELRARVDELLDGVVSQASNISFKSIGAIGFVLLIWAALALIVEVETTFNRIYLAPQGRPWAMRIAIYWASLTLGPVLMFASLYTTGRLLSMASEFLGYGGVFLTALFGQVAALIFTWLLLLLLYRLLPNTRVELRPALIGSLVAAVLWEVGKRGFQWYVGHSVTYSKLYGSLGMIPLFLLWVYLTWLITMFGLELSFVLQSLRGKSLSSRLPDKRDADRPAVIDARWMLPILSRIARSFAQGQPVSEGTLSLELSLPLAAVSELCGRLTADGLIRRVEGSSSEPGGFTLALPAEKIELSRVLRLASELTRSHGGTANGTDWAFVSTLERSDHATAGNATLATLL